MLPKIIQGIKHPIKIWTNDIEQEAINQLEKLSSLPFIHKHIAVMPDVHAGKGSTIGTVIATKGAIIPAAYKSIDEVMANQTELVSIEYTLKQLIGIKG